MSLLNRGREVVTVYPEVATVDRDGNTVLKPSAVGVVARATIQPMTSTEDTAVAGDLTVTKHRMRLVGYPDALGARSQVEWGGKRYSLFGDPRVFNGSSRTGHTDYVLIRK